MHDIKKNCFKYLIAIGWLLFFSDVFSYEQQIYLADEPLPRIIQRIRDKEPGILDDKIRELLKQTLTLVTPEIAERKFNIKWIDNSFSTGFIDKYIQIWEKWANSEYGNRSFYPALVISYMGKEVGSSLFTLDDIKERQIIAEYTGNHASHNTHYGHFNDYALDGTYFDSLGKEHIHFIDARYSGNASRFASHIFFLPYDLGSRVDSWGCWWLFSEFGFGKEIDEKIREILSRDSDDLAVQNASLFNLYVKDDNKANKDDWLSNMINGLIVYYNLGALTSSGKKSFVWAKKHISAFEQIGVDYGCQYWKDWYKFNKGNPCLFYKNGNVRCVSSEKYLMQQKDLDL